MSSRTPRRVPLGLKLGGLSAALLALMVVVTIIAVVALNKVADNGHNTYVKSVQPLAALSDARATFNLNRALAFKHILEPNAQEMAKLQSTIDANSKAIDADLAKVRPTLMTATGKADFAAITSALAKYNPLRDQLLKLSATNGKDAAYAFSVAKVTNVGTAVTNAFNALDASKQSVAATQDASSQSTASSSRWLVIGLLIGSILIGGLLAFLLARSIRRSVADLRSRLDSLREHCIGGLRNGLEHMAQGDLTIGVTPVTPHITRITNDELGDAARAVNGIRDATVGSVEAYNATRGALGDMIGEVTAVAGTIGSSSGEVAETSSEAGRAVGEIAHAVTDMAEGAERQVRMVEDARIAAEATTTAATRARELAVDGVSASEQATDAMAAVRNATIEASDAIRALAAKSDEVSGIAETIGGIAEQTNLLALNAAIEAARAGDQGRGFAVVAEEVRKLAEESQAAAGSIATLIEQIQTETATAVRVVEDGAKRSEEGAGIVAQARAAFDEIGEAVTDVAVRIEAIATATSEVAAVAEQSSASTEEVSASTQETSASAQQIAASAQQLAATAEELESLVGRFHLSAA
jgi:methyl-accepting chemotaxis protein